MIERDIPLNIWRKKEFLVVDELVLASILMFCVRHGLIKHLNCYCYFS